MASSTWSWNQAQLVRWCDDARWASRKEGKKECIRDGVFLDCLGCGNMNGAQQRTIGALTNGGLVLGKLNYVPKRTSRGSGELESWRVKLGHPTERSVSHVASFGDMGRTTWSEGTTYRFLVSIHAASLSLSIHFLVPCHSFSMPRRIVSSLVRTSSSVLDLPPLYQGVHGG